MVKTTLNLRSFYIAIIMLLINSMVFSQETTIELPKMANRVVNDFIEIATIDNYDTTYQQINKLKFLTTKRYSKEIKLFPLQTKATWVKLKLKNNYTKDTIFYLKFPFAFNLKLFCKTKNQLLAIGCSGTNCNRNMLSVKNDEARIVRK
jgi:hypothetical protein